MPRIKKPAPPEHIVVLDTNIVWHEDKSHVVCPNFEQFWTKYASTFPMKLTIPEIVKGELLFQQTTSAQKNLKNANKSIETISGITSKTYSHRITETRIKREVEERFDRWAQEKKADIWATPITEIDWAAVIKKSTWRELPFAPDEKNPKNEKGFRDMMILETVSSLCESYSKTVNIAFICNDYALRTSAELRLGKIESFSTYESLKEFESFIQLTKQNLTERFVKSILNRAKERFHNPHDKKCLIKKDGFGQSLRKAFQDRKPPSSEGTIYGLFDSSFTWKPIGKNKAWVSRPQFVELEGENLYKWNNSIEFLQLYTKDYGNFPSSDFQTEFRLMTQTIQIHWSSRVRSDGRFFECKIDSHEEESFTFEPPTTEELDRLGIEVGT